MKKKTKPTITGVFHSIAFHHGRALHSLAQAYPTLLTVLPEGVQNAVDSDVEASRVEIVVDYKRGVQTTRDNGRGTTQKKFADALGSVATPNRKGSDSIGRFGIGLISPLGKCESFEFTSRPKRGPSSSGKFTKWTFNCKKILDTAQNPDIPVTEVVPFEGPNPWWSSEMKLLGISKDKTISSMDIDDLARKITGTLGIRMRRLGTVLSIKFIDENGKVTERNDIKAPEFRGEAIPVHEISTPSGKVIFRLFKAPAGKKKNDVLVGVLGDEFRFPIKHLRLSGLMPESALSHITSGLFEGEIMGEGIKLKAERQAFEQNGAYLEFGCAIEEWFKKVGSGLVAAARDDSQAVRYQELGLRALGVCQKLLDQPQFSSLRGVLDLIKVGSVGIMHSDSRPIPGKDPVRAFTTSGGVGKDRDEKNPSEKTRNSPTDSTPKDGHRPMVVEGPRGNPRAPVRKHSIGLTLRHEALEGSSDLYQFDLKTGTLTFNIRHPAWVHADESRSEQGLMRFQEMVLIMVLTCETLPETVRQAYRMGIEASAGPMGLWVGTADGIRRKSSSLELE